VASIIPAVSGRSRPAALARLGLAALAMLLVAAKPALPPIVIDVAPGAQPHMPLRIKNIDLDVRVALSFDTVLIVNPQPAARAGLKPFPLIGKRTFKSAFVPGGEATFRGNLFGITPRGNNRSTALVIWVDKPIANDAEGVLATSLIKGDTITFNLGPQAPGALVYTIPRKGGGVMLKTRIGDEDINIALELNSPDTVMNARAAAALASAGLVRRNGQLGFWQPLAGVSLPFERMTPAPGATLIGLPIGHPAVRITEAQAKKLDALAKAGTSTAIDDDDTITVTASSKKKGRDPWILIGRDVLGKCSRIVFDRPGKAWVLTCAF